MTADEIATLVTAAGSILDVLGHADGRDKAAVYRQLGLRLTYQPEPKLLIAEARPSAIMYETECPRPELNTTHMPSACRNADRIVGRGRAPVLTGAGVRRS